MPNTANLNTASLNTPNLNTASLNTANPDHPEPAADAPRPEPRASTRLTVALAVIAGLAALTLVAPRLLSAVRPHLYTGTVLQGSSAAPPLDGLVHVDGTPVELSGFDGEILLVFFGYANCPDVCPTTLSTASLAVQQLGSAGEKVDLLMIGIDPARDRPADLEAYVDLFDARFQSASGSEVDIQRIASLYGVFYQVSTDATESTADGGYVMDHTASLVGVDRGGSLRIVWPPDVEFTDLAADLNALIS